MVIHTKRPDDQTIAGVLVHDGRRRLTIVDAEYVQSATSRHDLDNRVHVPAEHVAWIEELA